MLILPHVNVLYDFPRTGDTDYEDNVECNSSAVGKRRKTTHSMGEINGPIGGKCMYVVARDVVCSRDLRNFRCVVPCLAQGQIGERS